MSIAKSFKCLLLACLVSIVSGCKLAVIVVEGGSVFSLSGTRDCAVGSICVFETTTTDFAETFYAVSQADWYFVRWNSGGDFFCQDAISQTCEINNTALAGFPVAEALIASSKTYYIQPVFAPFEDTVVVNGTTWYQPALFTNLSWDEINAVCPSGPCVPGSMLNGQDMTGWTWATVDDMNTLFNSYIGTPELGPGPGSIVDSTDTVTWSTEFFRSGWRRTWTDPGYYIGVSGWTASSMDAENAYQAAMIEDDGASADQASTSYAPPKALQELSRGGWFYQ